MAQVVVQQRDRHLAQGGVDGRDLRQHVDAVGVLVDQPLQPADLPLDPPQACLQLVLALGVPRHPGLQVAVPRRHGTPVWYSVPMIIQALGHALSLAAAMAWEILWALILGFAISAAVQAVVSKAEMSRLLPDDSPRSLTIASGLGAASSSCSYRSEEHTSELQ